MTKAHSVRFVSLLNHYGRQRKACFFLISFDKSQSYVYALDSLPEEIDVRFGQKSEGEESLEISAHPMAFSHYEEMIKKVQEQIRAGNTYLLNLTCSTPLKVAHTLEEIHAHAHAPFKLLWKGRFACFSPERFVRIDDDVIKTYPMKGTIDSSLPDAEKRILEDPKEHAEHVMVVDLLRNDLGIVAQDIRVERFRYTERIKAGERELLQVSSEISGRMEEGWQDHLGDILDALLPAGSISGTPKKRTCEIIQEVESHERGFFTGVFGIFDGTNLDSAVAIRFIEEGEEGLIYKSGGGITIDSKATAEYAEMQHKIYVPVS